MILHSFYPVVVILDFFQKFFVGKVGNLRFYVSKSLKFQCAPENPGLVFSGE